MTRCPACDVMFGGFHNECPCCGFDFRRGVPVEELVMEIQGRHKPKKKKKPAVVEVEEKQGESEGENEG